MTLVIAAYGRDFVVLAADSRGTLQDRGGTRVELNRYRKLRKLNERVGLLMYGHADAANYLVEQFQRDKKLAKKGVSTVAHEFAHFCRQELAQIPPIARNNLPEFGYIVAGLDTTRTGNLSPRCLGLCSVDGFFMRESDRVAIEGKPILANYMFARSYHEELNEDELSCLVAQAIYDTNKVDGDVGGPIHMVIIDRYRFREIDTTDVLEMIEEWENPRQPPEEGEETETAPAAKDSS